MPVERMHEVEARGFFIGPHEGDPLGGAHYARFVGSGKNSLGVEVPVVPLGEDVNSEEALLWSPVSPIPATWATRNGARANSHNPQLLW